MVKNVTKFINIEKTLIYISFLIAVEAFIGAIIYLYGGTAHSFTHLMYIPIIIAGIILNTKGAVGTALIGGIILGPWMPLNVPEGIMQEPSSWVFRLAFFMIIGILVGMVFQRVKADHKLQIRNAYIYEMTGFPNVRKLKKDMNDMIAKQKSFSLMTVKITNMDQINRYIDYSIGEKSLLKAMETMEGLVDKDTIYSIFIDEFAVAMWGCELEDTYLKAIEFLDYFKEPILLNGIPVNINMKSGITNYPLHGINGNDLFKNLGKALDQGEFGEHQVAIYIDSIAEKNKAKFQTVASLYAAIKKDQFTIVYQPIINLKENKIMGVEALLRWNNAWGLPPDEFIHIAEDSGIIGEITKWVITHVIDQIVAWKAEGIPITVAINISSKDLKDGTIIDFTANYLKKRELDPSFIEFELTERVMIDVSELESLLNKTRTLGIKISLDDFGTGYNSLVQFVKLPINFLKIDKMFIDNLEDNYYRSLIQEIIIMAHNLGQEVIAEGVETEEQVELLCKMSSDNIQGYYFSKPLAAGQLKQYIQNYDTRLVKRRMEKNKASVEAEYLVMEPAHRS